MNSPQIVFQLPAEKSYGFIEECEMGNIKGFDDLKDEVLRRATTIFSDINSLLSLQNKEISGVVIGKTYCTQATDQTWHTDGLKNRWGNLYHTDYHYMIAFAVLTSDNVDSGITQPFRNKESLTIALENAAIVEFGFKLQNFPLENHSQSPGRKSVKIKDGQTLYIVIKVGEAQSNQASYRELNEEDPDFYNAELMRRLLYRN